ncbi:hypothetical protein D082_21210 [Synechocystis sp. PCC 6714]|nr:hypothetical protein D082_21210 [Synechocystis sp. PCC 6714]
MEERAIIDPEYPAKFAEPVCPHSIALLPFVKYLYDRHWPAMGS